MLSYHSVALKEDGTLKAWGHDDYDQVTDTPTDSGYEQVSCGMFHNVALKKDGTLKAWGLDNDNQVTDTPTDSGYEQIACGRYYNVALKEDGTLKAWGRDNDNQVTDTPTDSGYEQIACGRYHSVALKEDGTLKAWGHDDYNQVTDTPTDSGYEQISCGLYHSVALKEDGTLEAWGHDDFDQVTDTPTDNGYKQVSCGIFHNVALKEDGTLKAWGRDNDNQVTDTPTDNGYKQVSCGGYHNVALKEDGTLKAWGRDSNNQVTDTPTDSGYIFLMTSSGNIITEDPPIESSAFFYGRGKQYVNAETEEIPLITSSVSFQGSGKKQINGTLIITTASVQHQGTGELQAPADKIKGARLHYTGDGTQQSRAKAEMNASSNAYGKGKMKYKALILSIPDGAYLIDKDNYRSKNQPSKSDEMANKIIINTQPLVPLSEQQVYEKELTLSVGEIKNITAKYDDSDIPVIDSIASLTGNTNSTINSTEYYAWGADITIENTGSSEETFTLIINAKPLEVQGIEKVTAKDEASIREHEEIKYDLEENHLIQKEEMAQQIADIVLASAKDPRRDVELDWRGNPALILADLITVPEYSDYGNFYVTRQNLEYDGALTANTEGRKINV
ncbi:RCC1 domain-containing protein [Sporohalobacter salinus]|uniref:RCC1 domain-containing protein n=1 Tax=Sporohalobacter salinus TaxID=1494606 RepID=UPI001961D9CF|nr:RCC1 domain-containing protein [Sporohalobacter salinus]MBM7624789.1 hypothetical protein [Sporohalobacter salinus]